ncbi:metal-dependent transcriptional regulator [Staphylothermus hellenicus]|uniref:Iron (Metal) dependent repressor, DtxR family n=1 Tax=Staphylothermus hellenicus (strain DSM 12710 / JCM 10830 / BK20S6-10-b1 / P8) TaxID=591019 RepID=D7DC58_STAHD|nr:metal-dependent transcriptional regulator [Staphylothermus hellenicus]ADI31755.1 iron (metal) dependent repressor, DtxR family [Staphylothermus hellenicus DSM 12710]
MILRDKVKPWRAEDYLEAIHAMKQQGLRPRVRELARRLGIKPSSVVEYLKKLDELGYIVYKKGGFIKLTDKGKSLAEKVYRRHVLLTEFLVAIGVPRDIAEIDACYMEHGLHDETINKIMEFLKKNLKNKGLSTR